MCSRARFPSPGLAADGTAMKFDVMNKFKTAILLTLGAVSLSSCHIYQKFQLPEADGRLDTYKEALASNDSVGLAYLGWEEVFTDPILQGYIRTALSENVNLDNARLTIDQARAQLKGAKLSYFPSLTLQPNGGAASYGGSHMNWSYTIPAAMSWEVDAFGKILNRKRGAKASLEQAEAYEQAVRSQLVCGVASTYYALVLMHQQLALTKRTAEIWKDQVTTMELMKDAARTNEAAVVQSKANYYNILSNIPDLEQSIETTNHALSLLLNKQPQEWAVSSNLDFSLPVEVSSGVPISYLATRPDIKAAERTLAAAYYTTNSARAAFYPSIVISAQGGFTNLLGGMIKNPGEWFAQLAGSITAPLFSRGQNIATLEAAKASQQQALNNFEYSLLSAASDVSDALVAIDKNQEKRAYVEQQVDNLEKAVEYTQDLFQLDQSTSYLEVLTARSQLLSAQMTALSCWHAKVDALISLYQAVGGGR